MEELRAGSLGEQCKVPRGQWSNGNSEANASKQEGTVHEPGKSGSWQIKIDNLHQRSTCEQKMD